MGLPRATNSNRRTGCRSRSRRPMSDLADRVAELQAEAKRSDQGRQKPSRVDRVREDMASTGTFLAQATAALMWVWRRVAWPAIRFASHPTRWLFRQYRRLWAYLVYRRTRDGALVF